MECYIITVVAAFFQPLHFVLLSPTVLHFVFKHYYTNLAIYMLVQACGVLLNPKRPHISCLLPGILIKNDMGQSQGSNSGPSDSGGKKSDGNFTIEFHRN